MNIAEKKYRAAIIGCGRIASDFDDDPVMRKSYGISTHAGAYTDNPHIHLAAASDISSEKLEKFGRRWNVSRLYTDYRELLAREQVDILSICTWNTTHLEMLEEAAKHRVKAVFCEKPLSNSLRNADQMVHIAQVNGIVLLVNHRRRWDDVYIRVRDYISRGHLGKIQQVNCYYTSGIANTCSHIFDVLRMLFGEVKSVCAWYKGDQSVDDPDMDGYLIMEDGATVTLQSLNARHYSLLEFDIYGTAGRLRIENNGFKVSAWQLRDSAEIPGFKALEPAGNPIPIIPKAIMVNAVQNIVGCLSEGKTPDCSGMDGIKSLEIICAFHASAQAGNKPVTLPMSQRDWMIKSK